MGTPHRQPLNNNDAAKSDTVNDDGMADDRGPRDEAEIRFTAPIDHVRVLDGVCHGTGMDRTNVMRMILREWSERRLHEATILLRVAGRNATPPADDRQKGGK